MSKVKPRECTLHLKDGYFVEDIGLNSKTTLHVIEKSHADALQKKIDKLEHEASLQEEIITNYECGAVKDITIQRLQNDLKEEKEHALRLGLMHSTERVAMKKKLDLAVEALDYAAGQLEHAGYTKNASRSVRETIAKIRGEA